jgi:SAM-dependent methyltransferase
MTLLDRLISINKRVAEAITPTHVHETNVFGMYKKIGVMLMSHPRISTVVDIGAGKSWQFPQYYKEWFNIHLIGLDIDASEMSNNEALDAKIACDVVSYIPLAPASVDLFMIHSGMEHFRDNERTLRNMLEALRPGGFILAQFPNRYALFAIANRLLPTRASRWLLNRFMGSAAKILGYRAYYDRTNYSAFRKMFKRVGFNELYYLPGFFGSSYFGFFLPLFVCSYAIDMLCFAIGIKNLASYNLWILQRPGDPTVDQPIRFYAWR